MNCPHRSTVETTTYQGMARGVRTELCQRCGTVLEVPLIDDQQEVGMGFIDRVKSSKISQEAARATEEGRTVFLARINVGMTDAGASGSVTGAAEIIEAVEALGWRLDQMSYTQDKRGGPEGYYLFRRY